MATEYHGKYSRRPTKIKVRATTGGIHLFNRETGMNILFDEIRPSPRCLSMAPRQISIALTNACELACPYCYAPKFPACLPINNLKTWLCDLDRHGCIGIGFGGGEPTLYPNLIEICEFATNETNLAVTMTTHAHRFNNTLIKALDKKINFVRISMDGVGATYEVNRGRSFNGLIENIERISQIIPFGINFVVNSKTITDLDDAIQLAATLQAREFLLLPEQATSTRPGIDNRTLAQLNYWVKNYSGAVPLAISESNADGLPTCNPLPHENGINAYAHIDARGLLKWTSYQQSGVKINNLGIMAAVQVLKNSTELIPK